MDAITAWMEQHDPGANVVQTVLPGFTDSRTFRDAFPECVAYELFPQRHMTLYETAPLIHSADERIDVRDLGFAATFFRDIIKEMLGDRGKARLGGMALRNGLLVHGPTHWAAAVRRGDGTIAAASGHKPRMKGVDKVAGVRGVVRLGEAMLVIPLVKRALPEAKLPFQDVKVLGAMAAAAAAGGRVLRGTMKAGVGSETVVAVVSLLPAWSGAARRRARRVPRRRAQGDRRLRDRRRRRRRRREGARSAAARTSWRRCSHRTSRAPRSCATRSSARGLPRRWR